MPTSKGKQKGNSSALFILGSDSEKRQGSLKHRPTIYLCPSYYCRVKAKTKKTHSDGLKNKTRIKQPVCYTHVFWVGNSDRVGWNGLLLFHDI